jgi:hypothetical protein
LGLFKIFENSRSTPKNKFAAVVETSTNITLLLCSFLWSFSGEGNFYKKLALAQINLRRKIK